MSINLLLQANKLQDTARKGRHGDTTLRHVKGELSHVNRKEAKAIDWLGPLGEAWVEKIGSGTINPGTGLREYSHKWWHPGGTIGGWIDSAVDTFSEATKDNWWIGENSYARSLFDDDYTWKPSEGKWGIFGSTYKSRQRDKAKETEKQRSNQFETWLSENKDTDVAEMYATGGEDAVKHFLTNSTDTITDAATMKENEFNRVIDSYDTRKEEEANADWSRTQQQFENTSEDMQEDYANSLLAAGTQNAGSTFGLLTQAQQSGGSGFENAGSFGQEFAMDQFMDTAVAKQAGLDDTMQRGTRDTELAFEGAEADWESSVGDIHDGYNAQFWEQLTNWNDAKTA